MASKYPEINKLLDRFNNIQYTIVDSNKTIVRQFLDELQEKLNNQKSNCITIGSQFYKTGSSYETTSVSPDADFDIAMILPHPFVMDFFESTKTVYPGFYKLKCINKSASAYFEYFINSNDFLMVEQLRKKVFDELIAAIKKVSFEGYRIACVEIISAVRVKLEKSHFSMQIDIVPQIGGNIFDGDVPGWDSDIVAPVIKTFLNSTEINVLFNLSCPPHIKNENFRHLVVQPAFSLIEKEYLLKSDSVREAVRIAKAVMKHNDWTRDGLRSFHIKQIALSLYHEIKHADPWQGYKMIMEDLITMLEDGSVFGCFIEDQNIITKDEDDCRKLGKKIKAAVNRIHPNNILKVFGYM